MYSTRAGMQWDESRRKVVFTDRCARCHTMQQGKEKDFLNKNSCTCSATDKRVRKVVEAMRY